jgi:integral membrane protein
VTQAIVAKTGKPFPVGAYQRYRVLAYTTGVMLVLLTIGVILKYGFDHPWLEKLAGVIHGFLFIVYLVTVFDFGTRLRWPLQKMVLIMLAGIVPFFTFVAEHVVSRDVKRDHPELAAG